MTDPHVGDARSMLASIVESSADAIVGQDLDGNVTFWNAGAELLYGWSAVEMLGSPIRRLVPDDQRAEFDALIERLQRGEELRELLGVRQHRNGSLIHVSLTMTPIHKQAELVGVATIERDVTRRRRVDAIVDGQRRMLDTLARTGRLADSLRDLLHSLEGLTSRGVVPCVMAIQDEQRTLHPVATRLPDTVVRALKVGVPLAPGGHPAGDAAFQRQAVACLDLEHASAWAGLREALREAGFAACCATPIVSPGGEVLGTLDLYSQTSGAFRASDLEVATALAQTAALAIERDVTVRELKLGRSVLQALNDINGLLLAELDPDRIIRRVTDEGTRLVSAQSGAFFYNRAPAGGSSFELVAMAGENQRAFSALPLPRNTPVFNPTLTVGAVQRIADITQDPRYGRNAPGAGMPPGHPPMRSFLSAPVTARAGDVVGMLLFGHEDAGVFSRWHEEILRGVAAQTALALDSAWLFQQATERAGALAEADRRKDEFLAMLSHELRNPLGAMTTSIAALDGRPRQDAVEVEAVEILGRQARHMKRLVDDLLDVSRITRDKITLKRVDLDVRAPLQQAIAMMEGRTAERRIRLVCEAPAEPVWVSGDAVRLLQVFSNLIGNAIKFSDVDGTVEIRVGEEQDHVAVSVRDEGVGIPANRLDDIFEQFVQVGKPDRPSAGGGLGLGLTLTRALVRLHGGTITARSEGEGRGAAFEVRLPRVEAPADAPASTAPAPGVPAPKARRALRILLAEDQPDAASAMRLLLERWGHEVVHIADGQEALDRIEQIAPDVALFDIGLPGVDGWQLARQVRQIDSLRQLPLAALTGMGQQADAERSRAAGFDHHFVKPADPHALRAWLDAAGTRDTQPGSGSA